MSYASLFVCREKSVRCGSLCNERTRLALISVTSESSRSGGACLRCMALTSLSRRFLQRLYDKRGGEENASRHRCEERRMLRLLEMTWGISGKAGLNVITNWILWDSFLMDWAMTLNPGANPSFLKKLCALGFLRFSSCPSATGDSLKSSWGVILHKAKKGLFD